MSVQLPTSPTTAREHLIALWSCLPRLEAFAEPTAEQLSKVPKPKQKIVHDALDYIKRAGKNLNPSPAVTPYSEAQLKKSYDTFLELCKDNAKTLPIIRKFNEACENEARCYPWQASGKSYNGYIWAGALALAVLELPGFLKEDIRDHSEKLERMKAALTKELGRQKFELDWAFEMAMGNRV